MILELSLRLLLTKGLHSVNKLYIIRLLVTMPIFAMGFQNSLEGISNEISGWRISGKKLLEIEQKTSNFPSNLVRLNFVDSHFYFFQQRSHERSLFLVISGNYARLFFTLVIDIVKWFWLTFTILTSIDPDPSLEPELANPQLPVVTQMQTPAVLLLTMKPCWQSERWQKAKLLKTMKIQFSIICNCTFQVKLQVAFIGHQVFSSFRKRLWKIAF